MQSKIIYAVVLLIVAISCNKMVEIPAPVDTITTSQIFADSADAETAIAGLYSSLAFRGDGFASRSLTTTLGMSADELLPFALGSVVQNVSTNTVLRDNNVTANLWKGGFQDLYEANAIIEGVQSSGGISENLKNDFIGEAKFVRALINFYLVNIFGDIPLITSTDYKTTSLAHRKPISEIYSAIKQDLLDAQNLLPDNYEAANGERCIANKWAATALLARWYLYTGDYADAIAQSNSIIAKNDVYTLCQDLDSIFLKNNSESILQWQNNSTYNTRSYSATPEGYTFIPSRPTIQPYYSLTTELLNSFEAGDLRRMHWIDSTRYNNRTYFYPFKYKVGSPTARPGGPVTEYYTVLRLAEQYLIRAESNAKNNNLSTAIDDLNIIRSRAGLAALPTTLNQAQVLTAVAQERRIEFFAEWGHRWLDLKRTNTVTSTFSNISYKSSYRPYQQLYPIPVYDLSTNPNLTQNPGY